MQILKVYGPYSRKQDKRKVVVLRLADGHLTTKSYARFLYEQEHGLIDKNLDLTVDHIDENEQNDVLNNFQLLTRAENIRKSAKKAKMFIGICPICNKEFTKQMRDVTGNQKRQNKAGPFCSRHCAGIYAKKVQMMPKNYVMIPFKI